jgi:hypothetical protein
LDHAVLFDRGTQISDSLIIKGFARLVAIRPHIADGYFADGKIV